VASVSTNNITMPITYVVGLVVAIFGIYNLFELKADAIVSHNELELEAKVAHTDLAKKISLSRLKSDLGLARNSLTFMEQDGLDTPAKVSAYELMKSSVEFMTNHELELRK